MNRPVGPYGPSGKPVGPPPPAVVVHTNGPKSPVPLAAQNALFCIHAATNIEELQSVQIGGYRVPHAR